MRTLLLASLLLAAAPARAVDLVDLVDLTGYLAPRPEVGDYKVWEGRGIGALREEVIAVADEGDGYRIERRYTDLGVEIGRSEQLVTPGIETELRWTSGARPDAASILGIGDTWPLSLRPGKRARFRSVYIPYYILPGCCYESITTGNHRFVGFADWVDSRGPHALAAALTTRASTRSRHTVRGSWAWVWSPRVDGEKVERGFVAGVGLVGATAAYRTVLNGVVTKRFAKDLELALAVVQGAPYPAQD